MWLTLLLLAARATGAIFIFSGVSKLLAQHDFLASLRALPFLSARSAVLVVTILPWVEVALGSALIIGLWTLYVAWVALALLLIFSLVALVAVVRGLYVPCSCFGATSQGALSSKTVVRNLLLALLLLPLIAAPHPTPLSVDAMLSTAAGRSPTDLALITSLPLCIAGVAALIATAQRTLARLSPR